MQRSGPRGTLPPITERPRASKRWPLQVILGASVIAAAFLILRWVNQGPADSATEATRPPTDAHEKDSQVGPAAAGATAVKGNSTPVAGVDVEFRQRMARAEARSILKGATTSSEILALIGESRIAEAVQQLQPASAAGDRDATVVLARVLNQCRTAAQNAVAAAPDQELPQRMLEATEQVIGSVPSAVRSRIETAQEADRKRVVTFTRSCDEARFDSTAISQRLRRAAEAGHEASLWELGNETPDAQARRKYWLSAAILGFEPAELDLAESLMSESNPGDRRNRGDMNFWLQAAAKDSPRGKAMLGHCILNSCNAQPPDVEAAVVLLNEAATLGDRDAAQTLSSLTADLGPTPTDEERYALLYSIQQLNELGCYGTEAYSYTALESLRSLHEISSRLSPYGLEQARKRAAENWANNAVAARQAQGCD